MDSVDPTAFLGRLSGHIKSLPPEDSVAMIDTIVEAWPEILGDNRLWLSVLLNDLTGDYSVDAKQVENALGKADKLAFAAYPLLVVKNIFKSFNAINRAAKLDNVEGVTDLVNKGTDGKLVKDGVDIQDAASSAMPLKSTDGLIPGSNNKHADKVMKQNEEIDAFLGEVDSVNTFGLGLTEAEKTSSIERKISSLHKRPEVTGIEVEKIDGQGFTITYSNTSYDTPDVLDLPQRETVAFTKDEVGNFHYKGNKGDHYNLDNNVVGLISPNTRFGSDKDFIVELPQEMQFQSGKIRSSYDSAIRAAYKPGGKRLSKKEHVSLNNLLLSGDKAEKVYDYETLTTVGVDGVKYSAREAQAYQGIRKVVDHMYHAKDKQIADSMRANNVKVMQWKGRDVAAKAYDSSSSALTARRQTDNSRMIAVDDGIDVKNIDDITDEDLNKYYDKGFKLVRSDKDTYLPSGGTNVEWALVKHDKLESPGAGVLSQRVGYMPKISKEGHFFVKEVVEMSVGGKALSGGALKTIRYFNNRADARKFQDDLKELNPDTKYELLADRELSAGDREMEYTNISGGLFNGARSREPIPFGLDGVEGERVDALGSLNRYVDHLGKQMPYNLYRMGLRERWVNSALELGALKSKRGDMPFDNLVADLDDKHPSYAFLKDAHQEVQVISSVPTETEKAMRTRTTQMALWFEESGIIGGKRIAASLHGTNALVDAANSARSLTFHAMLGMFNPAQFAVQASGSIVAMSVNPILAAKAIPKSMAYSVLDMVDIRKLDGALDSLKADGFDVEGYKLWRESGIKHSVTSSNVDYQSITEGVPYDAGVLRRLLANDTMFFKSGELVNARISFATAVEWWKTQNKGKELTSDALSDIVKRTEHYRLNMTGANQAKFQKGITSLPLQFQQVVTKFVEKLANKDFTGKEKTRLVAGQALFFGSMGLPFVNAFVPSALESIGIDFTDPFEADGSLKVGMDASNTDPATLNLVKNGVMGWMFQDYLDINSVIGGRMTLGKELFENVFSTTEPVALPTMILGPTGNIYDKTVGGFTNFFSAWNTVAYADEVGIDKVAAVTKLLSRTLLEIPSSSHSLLKAHDMANSQFYKNKAGRPIFEWTDNNMQTILFQAFGFGPQETQDWYEIMGRNGGKVPAGNQNSDAKRILKLMSMLEAVGEDKKEIVALSISAIRNKYKKEDQDKIMDYIKQAIKEPKDSWEKAVSGVVEDWTSEMNDGVLHLYRNANIRTNQRVAKEIQTAGDK